MRVVQWVENRLEGGSEEEVVVNVKNERVRAPMVALCDTLNFDRRLHDKLHRHAKNFDLNLSRPRL
jgi:hypothetical protein